MLASEPAIGFSTALAKDLNPTISSADSEDWKYLFALYKRCANAVVGEYGWKYINVSYALVLASNSSIFWEEKRRKWKRRIGSKRKNSTDTTPIIGNEERRARLFEITRQRIMKTAR